MIQQLSRLLCEATSLPVSGFLRAIARTRYEMRVRVERGHECTTVRCRPKVQADSLSRISRPWEMQEVRGQ